ncbi:MAG TPA: ATP-binding protein, partial [Ktedonobacteraceae bacterium]|nr:ATP-binding protein [Ktedonobacteraceae bacterium]
KSLLEIFLPDDQEKIAEVWKEAMAQGRIYEVEGHVHHEDTYCLCLVRGAPVRGVDGHIREWVNIGFDITKSKQVRDSESQLREYVSLQEAIFKAITAGVFVADRAGTLIQTNPMADRLFSMGERWDNMSVQERNRLFDFYDDNGQLISRGQWPMQRILRGEVLVGKNAFETVMTGPEGESRDLNITGAPVRDVHNNIIGAVVVFHDITERRQLERRIQKALDSLLTLAELLVRIPAKLATQPAGQVMDLSTIISAVGQHLSHLICQVLEGECAGIALLEPETSKMQLIALAAASPEEVSSWKEAIQTSLLTEHFNAESISRLYTNRVVACNLAAVPTLLHGDNEPETLLIAPMIIGDHLIGVLGLGKKPGDEAYTHEEMLLLKAVAKLAGLMIERERLQYEWTKTYANERSLLETNRRFDAFLSLASHELRSPLTTIVGNVQLAQRRLRTLQRQSLEQMEMLDSKLERIQQPLEYAVHRANVQMRMISDLLDVSRIQANKLELRMRPCDLATVVRETVEDQRQVNPERTILLTMPDAPVPIVADRDRIGQVVHNYLTNALKYSPQDSAVAVRLVVEGSVACISVSDKGPGIPPEEHERIWERFYRVKGIEVQSGYDFSLGLGLHICHTIIERHQGEVGLESESGHGSTFWCTLPLTSQSPMA